MENDAQNDISQKKNESLRYQDFVIRDGELVGDFEGLYKNFDDPWQQSACDYLHDSRRSLALSWCCRLREEYKVNKVIELGCGFGHLTQALHKKNFSAVGVDVSKTAIEKARKINSSSVFIEATLSDFETLQKFDADIYLMAEITWYVLDDLDNFIKNLRDQKEKRRRPIFLIHLLTTYASGVQKYGVHKFTNQVEILAYFGLNYIESGVITTVSNEGNSYGTYFVAKI